MSNANARRHRTVGNMMPEFEVPDRRQAQRISELEAQVHYLREYAIRKSIEAHNLQYHALPTNAEIRFIVGSIDGNIAVAGERAKRECGG